MVHDAERHPARHARGRHGHDKDHSRGHDRGHGHHHHHPVKRRSPWFWVSIGGAGFVVLVVLLQVFKSGSYYDEEGSPEAAVAQAEIDIGKKQFQQANDHIALAEFRKPNDETKKRIVELRERIKKGQEREQDQAAIDRSKIAFDAIQDFQKTYLAAGESRPAVRELVRNTKQWLTSYGDVARRYPDVASNVAVVQGLVDRYTPAAHLDQPDDSTDVIFAADRRMALPRPPYTEVLSLLDGYIASHTNDPRVGDVTAKRNAVVELARVEFDKHEAEARRLLAAGRHADARKEVQAMRDASVMTSWNIVASNVESEINRASK